MTDVPFGVNPAHPGEGDDDPPVVRVPRYSGGTWTEVLEAQRSGTVEQIVVSQGLPMGPRGIQGPTGPTGAKGESTEWTVGQGPPQPPTIDNEIGEIWFDATSGAVWVLTSTGWVLQGNLMGPTGPTGPIGEPAYMTVGSVYPGGPGEAAVSVVPNPEPPDWLMSFVVPAGPTGPAGPPPTITSGVVTSVGPDTAPWVQMHGSADGYIIDWWLQQGATGPAGTNITIIGSLPTPGPPPTAGGEVGGDGWVDSNGDVWVWSEEMPGWVNTGPVVGPVGPTGPTGASFRLIEFPLDPIDTGLGTAVQDVVHSLLNPYPLLRVLLEEPVDSGIYTDSQSVYVYYTSATEVHVVMDGSVMGQRGKLVLM